MSKEKQVEQLQQDIEKLQGIIQQATAQVHMKIGQMQLLQEQIEQDKKPKTKKPKTTNRKK